MEVLIPKIAPIPYQILQNKHSVVCIAWIQWKLPKGPDRYKVHKNEEHVI